MEEKTLEKISLAVNCPVRNVLDRVGDKWSIMVLSTLGKYGTLRFNQLHYVADGISQKMLTVTLKNLEADGLLTRRSYPTIPPRVEYTLTKLGCSLLPTLRVLIDWASTHMPAILASREKYAHTTASL